MSLPKAAKIVVQSDFDGTITEQDVSYLLLDKFADGNWRQILADYQEGKIPVGGFTSRAFAMVKADRQTLVDFLLSSDQIKIRPGLPELSAFCAANGLELIIVSNGLKLYIETILVKLNLRNIKVFAARSHFNPDGMEVKYIGPDGKQVDTGLKGLYTELFLEDGYRVIYLGNGPSDFPAARQAHHVFATAELLEICKEKNLDCTPFNDLHDVIKGLKLLQLG